MTLPSPTVYPEKASDNTFKICAKCNKNLPLSAFYRSRRKISRTLIFSGRCRECRKEDYMISRQENPAYWTERNSRRNGESEQRREEKYWENQDIPNTKICTGCSVEKPLDDFFRETDGPLGRKCRCKECTEIDREKRKQRNLAARIDIDLTSEKICTNAKCVYGNIPQSVTNFFKNAQTPDGLMYRCRDCVTVTNKKWATENKDRQLETRRKGSHRRYMAIRESQWHVNATRRLKTSSKKRGLKFDMKPIDLLDPNTGSLPEFCPIFPHIRLDYAAGVDRRAWASVDKIVPELGYVTGNVCIISLAANRWKDNGSNAAERARIVTIMKGRNKPIKDTSQMGLSLS